MAEGSAASGGNQRIIITAIWAIAAVAIAGMVVFGILPLLRPQQPQFGYPSPQPYPEQGYSQPYQQSYQRQLPPAQYQAQQAPAPAPAAPVQPVQQPAPAPTPAPAQPQIASRQIPNTAPLSGIKVDGGFEIRDANIVQTIKSKIVPQLGTVMDVPPNVTPTPDNTIVMFMDPRCPYCQAAHKALSGKYAVQYVPMSILGTETTMTEAEPGIRGVLRQGDKLAALNRVMNNDTTGLDTSADPALQEKLIANREVWLTLAANLPDQQPAVPLFMVPTASGKLAVVKGWEEGMTQVMDELLKKAN